MSGGREVVVGAVILLSIAVVAAGTLFLKGARLGQEFTEVDALARDVGLLTPGNAVKFRGVNIGQVTAIGVVPSGNAVRVSMEIRGEIDVADDAVAIIAPESLFGDWQIEIVSRSRFPRYDYFDPLETETEEGVTVLGAYALPDISRLTAAADEVAENVGVLTDRFDRAFNEETAANLQRAINNIQQVSEDIARLVSQQASTFENVSAEVERAAGEISTAATSARQMLDRTDALLARGDVDSVFVNLRRATAGLNELVVELEGSTDDLDATFAQIDSTMANIRTITERVEDGEGSLGLLLNDSTLYVAMIDAVAQLDALLADMQENPARYINFSVF